MEITEVKIRKILNEKVRAVVSVVFDDEFAVHDMKIIRRDDGSLFVAMPYRRTAQGKQIDIVHPTTPLMREKTEKAVIAEYTKYQKDNGLL